MSKRFIYGLEVGRRYTWEEVESVAHGKWVVMKDCIMDGDNILSGIFVDASTDDKPGAMLIKYVRGGYHWKFTKYNPNAPFPMCYVKPASYFIGTTW